jgi:hypothetical protein
VIVGEAKRVAKVGLFPRRRADELLDLIEFLALLQWKAREPREPRGPREPGLVLLWPNGRAGRAQEDQEEQEEQENQSDLLRVECGESMIRDPLVVATFWNVGARFVEAVTTTTARNSTPTTRTPRRVRTADSANGAETGPTTRPGGKRSNGKCLEKSRILRPARNRTRNRPRRSWKARR